MNSTTGESSREQAKRIRAEAAVWMAWRHGPDWTAADEAALERWRAENPAHAIQFELAKRVWNETRALKAPLPPRPFLTPFRSAVTVAVLVAVLGVAAYFKTADVVTGVGEQLTLTLSDGTRVTLNTHTRFREHYNAQRREVFLKSGEAYFEVTKHEPRPFVVVAGDREVVAMGTEFTVRREDSSDKPLAVTLIDGRVAVAPTGAPIITPNTSPLKPTPGVTILSAGERAMFRSNGAPVVDTPPLDAVTSWKTGWLRFVDTPLPEAVAEFNRYSRKRIIVRAPEEGTIHVSGVFRIDNVSSFLRAVAEANNLTLRVGDNELILESPARSSGKAAGEKTLPN